MYAQRAGSYEKAEKYEENDLLKGPMICHKLEFPRFRVLKEVECIVLVVVEVK